MEALVEETRPKIQLFPPEILTMIFEDLSRTGWPEERQVSACARTCKAFHGPAIDIVWNSLTSFNPLILCLPFRELCTMDQIHKGHTTLRRPPVAGDWIRFDYYAQKVKHICAQCEGDAIRAMFDILIPHRADRPLLPNLQSLIAFKMDPKYTSLIYGPTIEKLMLFKPRKSVNNSKLTGVISPTDVLLHMANVTRLSPGIRELMITKELIDPLTISSLIDILTSFRDLRNLSCFVQTISRGGFLRIMSLPKLERLGLIGEERGNVREDLLSPLLAWEALEAPEGLRFRSLKDLCLLTHETFPRVLHDKFSILSNLNKLLIYLRNPPQPRTLERWLLDIRRYCSPAVFASFTICPYLRGDRYISTFLIRGETLTQLCNFTNLHHLEVSMGCPVDLDDSTIEQLVSRWPRMTALILGTDHSRIDFVPRVTANGLATVIRLCPELERLSVEFDARTVQGTHCERPGNGIKNEGLWSFHIGSSPIDDVASVAEFLSGLLPGLKHVTATKSESRNAKLWGQVSNLMVPSSSSEQW